MVQNVVHQYQLLHMMCKFLIKYYFTMYIILYYKIIFCMFRGSLNHMARLEKENHRTTPPRYQKYHVNGNLK